MILRAVQTFSGEPARIFEFFADARNLERITPPWLSFRILTPGEIEMKPGTTIDYALRMGGLPLRWRSEITAFEPGVRFIDTQLRGPYKVWIHEHRFVQRDGLTEVHDHVEYEAPGPPPVERLFVRPQLRRIFEYRQVALAGLFLQSGPATLEIGNSDLELSARALRPGGVA